MAGVDCDGQARPVHGLDDPGDVFEVHAHITAVFDREYKALLLGEFGQLGEDFAEALDLNIFGPWFLRAGFRV